LIGQWQNPSGFEKKSPKKEPKKKSKKNQPKNPYGLWLTASGVRRLRAKARCLRWVAGARGKWPQPASGHRKSQINQSRNS